MNRKRAGCLLGVCAGFLAIAGGPTTAMAETIELQPRVATRGKIKVRCPEKVIAYQTARPYQEGSYTRDGMINLQAIASQISLVPSDPFSAVWVGTLKPEFRTCRATAGMSLVDGQAYENHSYLRLRFLDGKVYAILDMTGLKDANQFTPVILSKEMKQGNARWTWGGTD
jgi:hypothetical protein